MKLLLFPFAWISLLLMITQQADARTWVIRDDGTGDAPTIQAGIDAAVDGDSVLVAPGYFPENIDFKGKGILVRGAGSSQTTLDGSNSPAPSVLIVSGEGRDSILEHLRITGGSGLSGVGGGVFINRAEPVIRGNVIEGNTALEGVGGGLYLSAGDVTYQPLLEGNMIANNEARTNGGGIAVFGTMAPEILDNDITGNETLEGDGGGIWLFLSGSGAYVHGNRIENNRAADHAGGIVIVGQGSTNPQVDIVANVIVGNVAEFKSVIGQLPTGGGIWVSHAQVRIQNNTIARNATTVGRGGAIGIYSGLGIVIERNIIALTESGGGIHCEVDDQATIRDNLVWQNVGGDGSGFCPDWWQSNGNIVADPYFCNAEMGDFTVSADSPALTHPAGPLGAFPIPGCGPVPTIPTTWGHVKSKYVN